MARTSKNNNTVGKAVAIGAGVAAVAAAAYFFLGPDGKRNQKRLKSWMVKMKGEVLEKLENAKEITEPIYAGIVETVAGKYIKAGKISKEEINELARELKRHWKTISHSVKGGASRRGAPAKKRRVATKTGRK